MRPGRVALFRAKQSAKTKMAPEFTSGAIVSSIRVDRQRLNTVAGSIRVTLKIADIAEITHIPMVSTKSIAAREGVMTICNVECIEAHDINRLNDRPSA